MSKQKIQKPDDAENSTEELDEKIPTVLEADPAASRNQTEENTVVKPKESVNKLPENFKLPNINFKPLN